ncbi:cupin [Hydrogenovibrio sp. SC-1]|uniref:cupin domain-containing protein n=1 Tax=Hydrogenovibrio sp. SC-1 TaxID=2065820 RepID=UPI000C7C8A39|nr:cupin domain-containing protein [Hydrogenovibrio sp. SC-1]PLA74462.1 cupin [Hydrogenovibrio sp. SC-1]
MQDKQDHLAIQVDEVPLREMVSSYPEPFASQMAGRAKRQLGDFFGLTNFGVNLTTLAPHAVSAIRHAHSKQDEFLYILQGHPTLHTDQGPIALAPGMCSGMKAGTGQAYSLSNDTEDAVVYLEIGDRTPGDEVTYPDDDLQAIRVDDQWQFLHKDGSPY